MPVKVFGYLILISTDFTILLIYFLLNLMLIEKIYQTLKTVLTTFRVWYNYLCYNVNLEFFSLTISISLSIFFFQVCLLRLCILSKPVVYLKKHIFFNFTSSTFYDDHSSFFINTASFVFLYLVKKIQTVVAYPFWGNFV